MGKALKAVLVQRVMPLTVVISVMPSSPTPKAWRSRSTRQSSWWSMPVISAARLESGRDHAGVAVGEDAHGGAALVEAGDARLLVDVLEVVDLLEGLDGDLPVAGDDGPALVDHAEPGALEHRHLLGEGVEPVEQGLGVGVLVDEDPAVPCLATQLADPAPVLGGSRSCRR